jgi:hypothetical protein
MERNQIFVPIAMVTVMSLYYSDSVFLETGFFDFAELACYIPGDRNVGKSFATLT